MPRLANLKQTRTFVRVVYHHSRMAMRSHFGGRGRHEALGEGWKVGQQGDPLAPAVLRSLLGHHT